MNAYRQITSKFPKEMANFMNRIPESVINEAEELRIRCGQNILLRLRNGEYQLDYRAENQLIQQIVNNLIQYSYYAYEDDIARGFVTIEGGHRVGICGRMVAKEGRPAILKEISSLNIRFAREVPGCCRKIFNEIIDNRQPLNTLIVSPPGCGKTTILRDISRELSERKFQVAICDERSEIAGMHHGKPGFNLGPCCDVLDGCEKAWGIPMLIRSMAPQVILTDEIGKPEDVPAVMQCLSSGVILITTIHGSSVDDVLKSAVGPLIEKGVFSKIIFLTNVGGAGSLKEVIRYV